MNDTIVFTKKATTNEWKKAINFSDYAIHTIHNKCLNDIIINFWNFYKSYRTFWDAFSLSKICETKFIEASPFLLLSFSYIHQYSDLVSYNNDKHGSLSFIEIE